MTTEEKLKKIQEKKRKMEEQEKLLEKKLKEEQERKQKKISDDTRKTVEKYFGVLNAPEDVEIVNLILSDLEERIKTLKAELMPVVKTEEIEGQDIEEQAGNAETSVV